MYTPISIHFIPITEMICFLQSGTNFRNKHNALKIGAAHLVFTHLIRRTNLDSDIVHAITYILVNNVTCFYLDNNICTGVLTDFVRMAGSDRKRKKSSTPSKYSKDEQRDQRRRKRSIRRRSRVDTGGSDDQSRCPSVPTTISLSSPNSVPLGQSTGTRTTESLPRRKVRATRIATRSSAVRGRSSPPQTRTIRLISPTSSLSSSSDSSSSSSTSSETTTSSASHDSSHRQRKLPRGKINAQQMVEDHIVTLLAGPSASPPAVEVITLQSSRSTSEARSLERPPTIDLRTDSSRSSPVLPSTETTVDLASTSSNPRSRSVSAAPCLDQRPVEPAGQNDTTIELVNIASSTDPSRSPSVALCTIPIYRDLPSVASRLGRQIIPPMDDRPIVTRRKRPPLATLDIPHWSPNGPPDLVNFSPRSASISRSLLGLAYTDDVGPVHHTTDDDSDQDTPGGQASGNRTPSGSRPGSRSSSPPHSPGERQRPEETYCILAQRPAEVERARVEIQLKNNAHRVYFFDEVLDKPIHEAVLLFEQPNNYIGAEKWVVGKRVKGSDNSLSGHRRQLEIMANNANTIRLGQLGRGLPAHEVMLYTHPRLYARWQETCLTEHRDQWRGEISLHDREVALSLYRARINETIPLCQDSYAQARMMGRELPPQLRIPTGTQLARAWQKIPTRCQCVPCAGPRESTMSQTEDPLEAMCSGCRQRWDERAATYQAQNSWGPTTVPTQFQALSSARLLPNDPTRYQALHPHHRQSTSRGPVHDRLGDRTSSVGIQLANLEVAMPTGTVSPQSLSVSTIAAIQQEDEKPKFTPKARIQAPTTESGAVPKERKDNKPPKRSTGRSLAGPGAPGSEVVLASDVQWTNVSGIDEIHLLSESDDSNHDLAQYVETFSRPLDDITEQTSIANLQSVAQGKKDATALQDNHVKCPDAAAKTVTFPYNYEGFVPVWKCGIDLCVAAGPRYKAGCYSWSEKTSFQKLPLYLAKINANLGDKRSPFYMGPPGSDWDPMNKVCLIGPGGNETMKMARPILLSWEFLNGIRRVGMYTMDVEHPSQVQIDLDKRLQVVGISILHIGDIHGHVVRMLINFDGKVAEGIDIPPEIIQLMNSRHQRFMFGASEDDRRLRRYPQLHNMSHSSCLNNLVRIAYAHDQKDDANSDPSRVKTSVNYVAYRLGSKRLYHNKVRRNKPETKYSEDSIVVDHQEFDYTQPFNLNKTRTYLNTAYNKRCHYIAWAFLMRMATRITDLTLRKLHIDCQDVDIIPVMQDLLRLTNRIPPISPKNTDPWSVTTPFPDFMTDPTNQTAKPWPLLRDSRSFNSKKRIGQLRRSQSRQYELDLGLIPDLWQQRYLAEAKKVDPKAELGRLNGRMFAGRWLRAVGDRFPHPCERCAHFGHTRKSCKAVVWCVYGLCAGNRDKHVLATCPTLNGTCTKCDEPGHKAHHHDEGFIPSWLHNHMILACHFGVWSSRLYEGAIAYRHVIMDGVSIIEDVPLDTLELRTMEKNGEVGRVKPRHQPPPTMSDVERNTDEEEDLSDVELG